MSRTAKLSTALVTIVLATMTLAGCTATAAPEAAEQTPKASPAAATVEAEPTPTPTPESTEPKTCSNMSEVVSTTGGLYWERRGTLRDMGARPFAEGEVTLDEDGVPVTYTVASGDVEAVIAERLCAYPNLGWLNHVRDIYPDQVLWLSPNPELPSLDLFSPMDAEAGFQQIPYQDAMSAARQAVDAGDIDTVRSIWNNTIKGMLTSQELINAIQQVIDSGDPDGLRQLFS